MEAFLSKIDEAFTYRMTVTATSKQNAKPDLQISDEQRTIEVILPEGVSARILIRPAVPGQSL